MRLNILWKIFRACFQDAKNPLFEYINFVCQGALVFYSVLLVRGKMGKKVHASFSFNEPLPYAEI